MYGKRLRVVVGAASCALAVGVSAAALDRSVPPGGRLVRPGDASVGGSLLALLVAALQRLLALLGVDLPARGSVAAPRSVFDALFAVVAVVAPLVPWLIAALGLGVAGALAWGSYRRTPLARAESRPDRPDANAATDDEWPADASGNDVYATWAEMVVRSGVESPRTATPDECATAAVDSGLDPAAVAELTRLFAETRYGPARATPERARRARHAFRRLDGGTDE